MAQHFLQQFITLYYYEKIVFDKWLMLNRYSSDMGVTFHYGQVRDFVTFSFDHGVG